MSQSQTFVTVAGVRLAVQALDGGGGKIPFPMLAGMDKPVLVFVHEGLGCIRLWRDFPERLCQATGLPGLLYDRQGFGESDPLDHDRTVGYLEREAFDVLPRVLEQTGVENHILVGHSDGGSIALLAAAGSDGETRSQGLRAIICEAAHVFVEPETIAGIRQARENYHSTDLPKRLAKYHGDKTDRTFRNWADLWLTEDFQRWSMADRLRDITVPVLALQGVDDEYGTQHQVDTICRGVSGLSQGVMVPDCAHIPHLQAPEAVLAEMVGFLKPL